MPLTSLSPSGSAGRPLSAKTRSAAIYLGALNPDFPSVLRGLSPELWVLGNADALRVTPRVTIVGSRSASTLGLKRARELGRALAQAGALVVSGGALGIDGAAHRGALDSGGRTCAVLGTGVDVTYPSGHESLFADITEQGCLLSMMPLGSPPRPGQFPQRNQLMAALADLVVVVEAQLRSGTGYTARTARSLGRPVVCFSGSPGTAAMIDAGDRRVDSVADVLGLLGRSAGEATASSGAVVEPAPLEPLPDDLDPVSLQVLGTLSPKPIELGELCARTGLSAADCAAAVIELELCGRCSRLPGNRYVGHAPLC